MNINYSNSHSHIDHARPPDLYTSKPFIPCKIIRYIAQNKLHEVVKRALNLLYNADDINLCNWQKKTVFGSEMLRNCRNTVYMLALLFLGQEKAKNMVNFKFYRTSRNVEIQVPLPSGKTWNYTIHNLFAGNISHEISKDSTFFSLDFQKQNEAAQTYMDYYVNKYKDTIKPEINKIKSNSSTDEKMIKEMQKKILNSHYPFNKTTIESLRQAIFERNEKVNNERSFIYILIEETHEFTNHMCILEQFFLESSQEVAFRRYQSWVGEATLFEDFKRQYGQDGENYWNMDAAKEFLNNLNAYYCLDPTQEGAITSLECYGYNNSPFLERLFDGQSLIGKTFEYQIYEINPEQCIDNLKFLCPDLSLAQITSTPDSTDLSSATSSCQLF